MTDHQARAVAVVGVGALLPDAPDAPSFWKNLCDSRYSITEVPPERWSVDEYYDPNPASPDKTYSKIGSWIRGYSFDWQRYSVPPKVAGAMDQGQQWAVTIAAEALADYGLPGRALDLERTGVVLGSALGGERHYLTTLRVTFPELRHALEGVEAFSQLAPDLRRTIVERWQEEVRKHLPPVTADSMPGELANIISGRVANLLNLRGPSFITDAACASSLAAVEAARDLLVGHQCDAVITGGVDRNMGASTFVKFSKIGALSATGSRPFGEGADGFVMGEGAAAFLLKRLADAERDGDRIYAVIRGAGASSDGKGKGITAPNPTGQKLAVQRAWQDAGVDPATAGMVEAHGTSTKVGDVVEIESLASCFASAGRGAIALGSVKSNVGHLKAGAGAAGLLKTVLAIHHRQLPPTLNAARPNPAIDFPATPFTLNHQLRDWPRANGTPRRAGLSAYGFGGTNFHLVVEEHVPGMLDTQRKATVSVPAGMPAAAGTPAAAPVAAPGKTPMRGLLALGAPTVADLRARLARELARVKEGAVPAVAAPSRGDLCARERIVVDFEAGPDLVDKLERARRALETDAPAAWRPFANQGVFRGSGQPAGKVAFLFPGQGSQFVNMGRALRDREPVVRAVFDEADAALAPILGRPLTSFLFADPTDPAAMARAEEDLRQTAITQPAVLTLDNGIRALLAEYGITPDDVMGHSLGEYGALVAAGVMPFADALEASAARGREMTRVSFADNGWMAAVMGPLEDIEKTLASIDGYVVIANINSRKQAVIGGESQAVQRAMQALDALGLEVVRLPVSHAFHTRIVAPAAGPMGEVLDRLHISPPRLPVIANVTGELYPTTRQEIRDLLVEQIASPVQWVRGLETLWREGVRTFVEVGPKKALKGFVDEVLGGRDGLVSLFTNHPKVGEIAAFNQALCGLLAAGHGVTAEPAPSVATMPPIATTAAASDGLPEIDPVSNKSFEELAQILGRTLATLAAAPATREPADGGFHRNRPPAGSVVISGCGLGLPGPEKPVMDPQNADRILRGEQLVDLLPVRFRERMARKHVTRVVKTAEGDGSFETIDDPADVLKLAGRAGPFDLAAEYGVPRKLVEALDITTQLAIAAGMDALREAGIPLVQTWRRTTKGTFLPERWVLPESMRDETGVIFGSAFPGFDRFAEEVERCHRDELRRARRATLEELRRQTSDPSTLREIQRQLAQVDDELRREPYGFDRRFLLRVLAMGHSQFAEYIGARGPNTQVNAACASTAQAIAMAEDWIRSGRCRRVVVIAGDDADQRQPAGVGRRRLPRRRRGRHRRQGRGGGAAVRSPPPRHDRRHGRGGAGGRERGRGRGARHARHRRGALQRDAQQRLPRHAPRRGPHRARGREPGPVRRAAFRAQPPRHGAGRRSSCRTRRSRRPAAAARPPRSPPCGGCSARRQTKSSSPTPRASPATPMGVGVEDVVAVKILEHGIVPPVPNFREEDPELGR